MKELFSCKARHSGNVAQMKRKTISTEDKEVQDMYGHSNKHMDEATKIRETVAKGEQQFVTQS